MSGHAISISMPGHHLLNLYIRYEPYALGFTLEFASIHWMLGQLAKINDTYEIIELTAGTASTHEAAAHAAATWLVKHEHPEWFQRRGNTTHHIKCRRPSWLIPNTVTHKIEQEIKRCTPDIANAFSSHYLYKLRTEVLELREQVQHLTAERERYMSYREFRNFLNVVRYQTQPQF